MWRPGDAVLSTRAQPIPVPVPALLDGVHVVELSRHVAGAYCGRLFVELGATVTRFGPPTDAVGSDRTRRAMQQVLHAGKLAATLGADGLDTALALARVVIVEKDDCDDALAAQVERVLAHRAPIDPDAVVVVLSACGSDDGYRPGCGLTSSAWAAMSWAIGEPGREPLTPPWDIVDYEAGTSAAAAALASLLADAGARSSPIDVAARDVVAHLVGTLAQNYLPFGRQWQRDGRRPFMSGGIYPLGIFSCQDGFVALYCRSDEQWHGILRAMGDPEWGREARFRDPRVVARRHGDEADSHLLPWLARHTKNEIMDLGLRYGFPAAPVRFVGETLGNPQFVARGSLLDLDLGDGTRVKVPAAPWRVLQLPDHASIEVDARPPARGAVDSGPGGLLAGLRVLDLSWVWSGPLVTSMLADLGAEVIKIEHPSRLDSVRQRGRPIRDGREVPGPVAELNPWFNQLNHGKKSVVLDIKSPSDRERVLEIAATCDVVVENMRPGVLARLGLGYADFAALDPSLVVLSMSLVGQSGPLSQMAGYAGIMTSMAGLEALVGYREADGSESVVGMAKTALGDPNAAAHGFCTLMAALYRRQQTGRGCWIDLSQTDAILSILAGPLIESQLHGAAEMPGNRHPLYAPHGHFACREEATWVALSVQTERQWQRFVAAVDEPALRRFAAFDAARRVANRAEIEAAVAAWASNRPSGEIVGLLGRAGVPVAPVASYQDMLASSWRPARGLACMVDHPHIGRQEIVVPPWRFRNGIAAAARPAPLLGADTEAVLQALSTAVVSPRRPQ